MVQLLGSAARFASDAEGHYGGRVSSGTYMAVADHSSFAPDSFEVTVEVDQITYRDFTLTDIGGPEITNVTEYRTVPDETGPYVIESTITDFSGIETAAVVYRVNGGEWTETAMPPAGGNLFSGGIPGQAAGSTIDFYIEAVDVGDNVGTYPADAPASYLTFLVTLSALVDDAETDQGWTLGWFTDTASEGRWVREDPVGTFVGSRPAQPEDDHTTDPGHICFVTANGNPGDPPGDADVDGGCTSIVSPPLDFSDAQEVLIYYWRWFGQFGLGEDVLSLQVSTNNGFSWTDLEVVEELANEWTEVVLQLSDFIDLTVNTRFRFVACDEGFDSTLEAAVDDISIEILPQLPAGLDVRDAGQLAFLAPARPNPVTAATTIRFRLATPSQATLELFDAGGRRVRQLIDRELTAGVHEIAWDGKDDSGDRVSAGVYFYKLRAGAFEQSHRLSLID
jgi:hypothetical protein